MKTINCSSVQDGVIHYLRKNIQEENRLVTTEGKECFIRYDDDNSKAIGISHKEGEAFFWYLLSGGPVSSGVSEKDFELNIPEIQEALKSEESVSDDSPKKESKLEKRMKEDDFVEINDFNIFDDGDVAIKGVDDDSGDDGDGQTYINIKELVSFYKENKDRHSNDDAHVVKGIEIDVVENIEINEETYEVSASTILSMYSKINDLKACEKVLEAEIESLKSDDTGMHGLEKIEEEVKSVGEIIKESEELDFPTGMNPECFNLTKKSIPLDLSCHVVIDKLGTLSNIDNLRKLAKLINEKFLLVDEVLTLKWDSDISIEVDDIGSTADASFLREQLAKGFEETIVSVEGINLDFPSIKEKTLKDLIANYIQLLDNYNHIFNSKLSLTEKKTIAEDNLHEFKIRHDSILQENEILKTDLANALVSSEGFSSNDVIKIANANNPDTLLTLKEKGII